MINLIHSPSPTPTLAENINNGNKQKVSNEINIFLKKYVDEP